MKYNKIVTGIFETRPNRFIAYVNIAGESVKVHVKNTGRCQELLIPGATCFLAKGENPERSTPYDLIAVEKKTEQGTILINMDSQAPNQAVGEWLRSGGLYSNTSLVTAEKTYGQSRIDFYLETTDGRKIFLEVKGVTLEENGIVSFPDAPTERGIKHLEELSGVVEEGYEAYVFFLIQMKPVKAFLPAEQRHPAFATALQKAAKAGVHILAYDAVVSEDSMTVGDPVPVYLSSLDLGTKPLLDWYYENKREMPWRSDPTPYHVWLSEIMLQQTRVEAVREYYARFLRELPTVADLANAPEEQLLKLWEGLGYYNRVRNLQKAAKLVMEHYDGQIPGEYEKLLSLPGIGSYTAGAISSIAFGQANPVVDGNVMRILSRLRLDGRDITEPAVKKSLEEELWRTMPQEKPGDFNQSLMELGATVCLPNGAPKCEECPWEKLCLAHQAGCESDYPVKSAAKARTIEKKTVLLIKIGERYLIHKRLGKGLLAGLYEYPMLEGQVGIAGVKSYLAGTDGLLSNSDMTVRKAGSAKHIFSHKEWHMTGYFVEVNMNEEASLINIFGEDNPESFRLATVEELRDVYAIPAAFEVFSKMIGVVDT